MARSGKNTGRTKLINSIDVTEFNFIVYDVVARVTNAGYTFFLGKDYRKDLLAVGDLALCEAAKEFDKSRGVKFSTYAYRVVDNAVRGEILKEFPYYVVRAEEELGLLETEEIDRMDWLLQSLIVTQIIGRANLETNEMIVFVGNVYNDMTLKELAAFLGVSESWISQLKKKAAFKIRKVMTSKGQNALMLKG